MPSVAGAETAPITSTIMSVGECGVGHVTGTCPNRECAPRPARVCCGPRRDTARRCAFMYMRRNYAWLSRLAANPNPLNQRTATGDRGPPAHCMLRCCA